MLFDAASVKEAKAPAISLWPDGKVFYTFDFAVTCEDRIEWRLAAKDWAKDPCIAFFELTESQAKKPR